MFMSSMKNNIINYSAIKLFLLPQILWMKMKCKVIEGVTSRRTFSGLLGGCLVPFEYINTFRV